MKFQKYSVGSGDGGGNFLKIPDNGDVTCLLRGDLFRYWQIWPQGGEKQIFDKPTAGAQLRFKANVVIVEDGKLAVKIWDFPVTVNNMLADIASAYDLTKTKIKISKHVQGKRTSYMILPLAHEVIAPKAMKEIEALKLTEFAPVTSAPAVKNYAQASGDDDGLPF